MNAYKTCGVVGSKLQYIQDIIKSIIDFLYHLTVSIGFPSYALSIVLISILLKIVLYPVMVKQMKSTMGMQEIQPKMQYLQKKYKNDQEKLSQEMMKLYKEYNVNPMAGCLPLLIQMPILFGLFATLRTYEFLPVEHAGFFWISNISNPDPIYVLPVLVGLTMFLQQKITMPKDGPMSDNPTMKMMLYVMPPMIGFFSIQFPAGLCIYWATFSVLGAIQQYFMNKKRKAELVLIEARQAEEKAARIEERKNKKQNPSKKKTKIEQLEEGKDLEDEQ